MTLIGIVIFSAAFLLIAWIYYLFLNIAIAIWFPLKAKEKWVEFVATPVAQFGYFFFKWVAPLWIVLVSLSVFIAAINYIISYF